MSASCAVIVFFYCFFKKMTSAKVAVVAALIIVAAAVVHAANSGKCGKDLQFEMNGTTLKITGTGPMYDADYFGGLPPWSEECKTVSHLDVGAGCTYIGKWMFANCSMDYVSISETVLEIGEYAFSHSAVMYFGTEKPSALEKIDNNAFEFCTNISGISFPESVKFIGDYAFLNCTRLCTVLTDTATDPGLNSKHIFDNSCTYCHGLPECTSLVCTRDDYKPSTFCGFENIWTYTECGVSFLAPSLGILTLLLILSSYLF